MKKLTPVLYVEEIEPCLPFWVDRLGFEKIAEVPEGDRLGFVILKKGDVELMYQTRASVESDVPALADTPMGGTLLFIEVDDLDAVERALEGVDVVFPRRTTFYGAQEIGVREPCGNAVTFAQFGDLGAEGINRGQRRTNRSSTTSSSEPSTRSSRSRLKPHFSRTRIEAMLCLTTYAWRGRSATMRRKAVSARVATLFPQCSLPIQ